MQPNDPHIMDYVLGIIAVGALTIGLISMLYGWIQERWWQLTDWWHQAPAYQMSSDGEEPEDISLAANNATTQQPATTLCSAGYDHNELLLRGQAIALAAMVKAGKTGETEGIKTVFHVSPSSSNPRYLAARAALKAELAKLDTGPRFPAPAGGTVPPTYPVSERRN